MDSGTYEEKNLEVNEEEIIELDMPLNKLEKVLIGSTLVGILGGSAVTLRGFYDLINNNGVLSDNSIANYGGPLLLMGIASAGIMTASYIMRLGKKYNDGN